MHRIHDRAVFVGAFYPFVLGQNLRVRLFSSREFAQQLEAQIAGAHLTMRGKVTLFVNRRRGRRPCT